MFISSKIELSEVFDETSREDLEAFWRYYHPVREDIRRRVREKAERLGLAEVETEFLICDPKKLARSFEFEARALVEGQWAPFLQHLRLQGITYAHYDIPFSAWHDPVSIFRQEFTDYLRALRDVSFAEGFAAITGLHRYLDVVVAAVGEAYLEAKEDATRADQARLNQALRSAQVGTWTWEVGADRVQWDETIPRLFGIRNSEFGGSYSDYLELIHPDDRRRVARGLQSVLEDGNSYLAEYRALWPDQTVRHIATRANVTRDGEGRPVQLTGVCWDITDLKQAEEEIRRLNRDLEKRVDERTAELAAANRELEAFASSVSHDLRSPLRGIDTLAHILQEDYATALDEEGLSHLGRIRDATTRMNDLIDDLLRLSRVAVADIELSQVDLSTMAAEIVGDLKFADRGRDVVVAIEPGMTCRGDRNLLRVALQNLFSNAWKFSRARKPAHIEFFREEINGETAYCIRDNGVGFDMRFAEDLFGVFRRLHPYEKFEGTGIGLATVRRVIERHHGRIWAISEPQKGAMFLFTIAQDFTLMNA